MKQNEQSRTERLERAKERLRAGLSRLETAVENKLRQAQDGTGSPVLVEKERALRHLREENMALQQQLGREQETTAELKRVQGIVATRVEKLIADVEAALAPQAKPALVQVPPLEAPLKQAEE